MTNKFLSPLFVSPIINTYNTTITFTDSTIGTKQDDAIRNITGYFEAHGGAAKRKNASGMFSIDSYGSEAASSGSNNYTIFVTTSANIDKNDYGNPMAGHANGDDIHPYDIYFLPLIAY